MMDIKVLSLKSAKKRREYMESQLYGTTFSFFDALSPNDIDQVLFNNKPDFLSVEAVATFESHRKIISSCKDVPLLILEDDATPRDKNFLEILNDILKTNNVWDIIIIGHFPDPKSMSRPVSICDTFMKLDKFIGMHSYIINPLSVEKIVSQLGEPITHIDYRISELIKDNNIDGIFLKNNVFRQNNWDFKSQIPKARDLLKYGKNK
jgi:GR25 family glycosyltransferase involved in LPS biosynthesis